MPGHIPCVFQVTAIPYKLWLCLCLVDGGARVLHRTDAFVLDRRPCTMFWFGYWKTSMVCCMHFFPSVLGASVFHGAEVTARHHPCFFVAFCIATRGGFVQVETCTIQALKQPHALSQGFLTVSLPLCCDLNVLKSQ